MGVRLDKPWRGVADIDALPGHMGVFELADEAGEVIFVGYAGGRSRFGLRGEIDDAVQRLPEARGFRYEVTTAYLTRYQELLMAHRAAAGRLPRCNGDVHGLGRLSPVFGPGRSDLQIATSGGSRSGANDVRFSRASLGRDRSYEEEGKANG